MSGTRFAASLLLAASALPVRAQHYGFRLFDRDSGLTSPIIQCLYQDRRGFIWVGTRNGLFRYEGARFEYFGPEHGLPAGKVEAVHQTPDGTVWAATGAGLARFTGTRFEKVDLDWAYQMYGPGAIDSSPGGTLYFATDRGLAQGRLADGRWSFSRVRSPHNPAEGPSAGVFVAPGGDVWYGCGTRTCIYDGRDVRVLGPEAGLPEALWLSIGSTPAGGVWLRNHEHFYVFDQVSPLSRARKVSVAGGDHRAGKPIVDHAGRPALPSRPIDPPTSNVLL